MLWTRTQQPQPSKLRVGSLTIDRAERRATLSGQVLDLSPLLLLLLEQLAEHPGRVTSRAELKRVLWPYAERIDTERRLNTAMGALRAALGDEANEPRFIETVRSHGYRWIASDRAASTPLLGLAVATALGLLLMLSLPETRPAPDLTATLTAQNAMEHWRRSPSAASARQASALLSKADAGQPSVLAMRAELELGAEWKWSAAERDYRRALDLDPRNADARLGLAWLRANQGRRGEAVALVRELLENNVASGDRRASLGWLLIRSGRPDLAAATCGSDASASINDLSCSHEALAALGRYAEARAVALRLMAQASATPADIDLVERPAAPSGYRAFLSWRAGHFLRPDASWFQKAQVLADAGETRSALSALEQSIVRREPMAIKIASTPAFVGMRGDPRFKALVGAVGA